MISTSFKNYKKIIISSKISKNGIYVDEDSLILYYNERNKKRVSVRKVNQDIMLDPRIPRDIDYQTDGITLVYVRRKNPQNKSCKYLIKSVKNILKIEIL